MSQSSELPAGRRLDLLCLAALLLLTLASLWPVGALGFIGYDDLDYVYQNAHVQSGLNADSILWAFTSASVGVWHPLTWLSHMLDYELFGLNPQAEHWVNLAFHAANTLLLFILLQQWTGARWRSFFVAALFACHPMHVQSVAWISERKDVLSGFFGILTLLAYTRYCRSKTTADYLLMLLLFIFGLMSKPMLITLPIIMLLLDFWPLGRILAVQPFAFSLQPFLRSFRPLLLEKVPLFLLCLISSRIALWAENSTGTIISLQVISWPDRGLNAVLSYARYLGKLLWPENLAILYPFPHERESALVYSGASLLLIALPLIGWWRRRSQPWLLIGWLWFFIMLLPVIGLVQIGLQSMADRYTYLPSIGLFIAVIWTLAELAGAASGAQLCPQGPVAASQAEPVAGVTEPSLGSACHGWPYRRRRAPANIALSALGTVILLACTLDTRHQLTFWRDNITLFQHVVEVTPGNNYLGNFYLGISYGEARNLAAAAQCLELSLTANPKLEMARSRLGNVLFLEKKYAEADPWLREVARSHSDNVPARLAFGLDLAAQGKYLEAQSEYQAAARLQPDNATISQMLTANTPKADAMQTVAVLTNELKTNKTEEICVQIAQAQSLLGDYQDAVQHYQMALTRSPESLGVLNNLAWLLATCPAATVRDGPQAVKLAEKACDLTRYQRTLFMGTLAAAYAEAGRFDDAILTAQKACTNASTQGEKDLLQNNQALLSVYQSHEAWHEPAEKLVPAAP